MWVIAYLGLVVLVLLAAQSFVLWRWKLPLKWTYGASSDQPRALRLTLKAVLHGTLLTALVTFPFLVGHTPASYFAPLLSPAEAIHFLYGEAIALAILATVVLVEIRGGWIAYENRFPLRKALTKSGLSALSSLTVVAVEEPLFRGILLQYLLFSAAPGTAAGPTAPVGLAILIGACLFSAAHFLRKVRTYWPAVGLAALGVWLGIAYYRTGSLWLAMGLHSGGILAIGVHRCFTRYDGRAWLVGTQAFPIAGLISIILMLVGAAITWLLPFGGN